jgi:4-hydroxy-tetrahydrodipicolinate synthase
LKANGADGVVVLGTTGEFPSFSVAEEENCGDRVQASQRLNIIVSQARLISRALLNCCMPKPTARMASRPPFYYKHPRLDGLTKYFSCF